MPLYQLEEDPYTKECDMIVLREQCTILEEKIRNLLPRLDAPSRQIVECYIQTRDDLEVLLINKSIRFGKRCGSGNTTLIGR